MENKELVEMVTNAPPERRYRRQAVVPALLLAVAAVGIFAFLEIAEEVAEGEVRAWDEALFLALRDPADTARPFGPPWFQEAALEITALGGYAMIVLVLASVVGLLLVTRRYGSALYTVLSVASGAAVSDFFKDFYGRPRPDLVEHLDVVHTASFPSGHAMMSTVAYLTLAALVVRFYEDMRVRVYVLAAALFISALVGASRVYLGVHWPSDVAAGWALGVAWACLAWLVLTLFHLLRRRSPQGQG